MTTAEATRDSLSEFREPNLAGLREMYAVGFITFEELEEGVHNVLMGSGAINVPRADPGRRWDGKRREWVPA